jgi:hypothetical protein
LSCHSFQIVSGKLLKCDKSDAQVLIWMNK